MSRFLATSSSLLLLFVFACGDDASTSNGDGGSTCCDASSSAGDGGGNDADTNSCVQGTGGTGNFAESLIDNKFVHGQRIQIVDINKDGANDVIVAFSLTDSVHLYINECDSWKLVKVTPANTLVAVGVASGDFDNDGDIDIVAAEVFARSGGSGSVRWYENPGTLTDNWTEHNITGATLAQAGLVEVADISGDGLPDLIVASKEWGPGVQWFLNTGGTFTGPHNVDRDLRGVNGILVHDVDGDGSLDVLATAGQTGQIAWYESDRDTQASDTITFSKHVIESVGSPSGLALGNLDDDDALELVASNARGIEVYDPPADPTGTWSPSSVTTDFAGDSNVYIIADDLNGDSQDDIALVSGTSQAIRSYIRTGSSYAENTIANSYTGINGLVSGDIDGDGDIDLLTSTYANGATDRISWWENRP